MIYGHRLEFEATQRTPLQNPLWGLRPLGASGALAGPRDALLCHARVAVRLGHHEVGPASARPVGDPFGWTWNARGVTAVGWGSSHGIKKFQK